jgi:hypothetical protein
MYNNMTAGPSAASNAQQGAAAAGLQQQVGQLNQQLAAIGYGSYSHINSGSSAGATAAAAAGAVVTAQRPHVSGDVIGRLPHITPALHAVQCGIRTSHTGVLLHAGLPGVMLSHQQQQALTAAAWSNTRLLMQQQQGAAIGAAAAASTAVAAGQQRLGRRSHTPEASVRPSQQQLQQQAGQMAAGVELLPSIQPLSVPGTLSDDDAWKLALTQPWVIQQEAARAQQLLAQVGIGAAAAAAAGVVNGGRAAAAAGKKAPGPGTKAVENAAGAILAPASKKTAAAVKAPAAAAAAGFNCQGVRSNGPAPQQQQQQCVKGVQQQQQQPGPSPRAVGGVFDGALRSSNFVNTM